jgi:hypothetical protein
MLEVTCRKQVKEHEEDRMLLDAMESGKRANVPGISCGLLILATLTSI